MSVVCKCNLDRQLPNNQYIIENGSDHSLNLKTFWLRNLRNNSTYAIGSLEELNAELARLNQQGENK